MPGFSMVHYFKWHSWPIRRKLLLIILVTIVASLVLVMVGLLIYELSTSRSRLKMKVTGVGDFIAVNSASALAFNDVQTAREILLTLRAMPEIAGAALYATDGRLVASYVRAGLSAIAPSRPPPEGLRFDGRNLVLVRTVQKKGSRFGTLYLCADMADLNERLKRYGSIFLVVSLAIGGGAFLPLRLLQRLVSEPLLRLSGMAERIAAGDLTARVPVESGCEIGQLAGSFNYMTKALERSYAELAEREERYRTLFESIDEGFCVIEMRLEAGQPLDYRFLEINQAFERHSLLVDAKGKWMRELRPEHEESWFEIYREVVLTGQPIRFEHGEKALGDRWFTVYAFRVGRPEQRRVAVLFNDITARKAAEREKERLISELERSNNDLQQFAYVASHDLQEPLRTIASYVELLARRYQGQLDQRADKYIAFVVEGANHMSRLINDLLVFSRVGARGKPFAPLALAEVLDQALDNLQSALEQNEAVLTRDELPRVTGDAGQLVQLFQNLIGNALKFRKKELPPRIHISVERRGQEWVFGVHDNGIGIEPQFYERIFVIFQRLHHREEYPGTGIGLAICRKIVENHGGRIWVEFKPGEGSSFYFSLPLREDYHHAS